MKIALVTYDDKGKYPGEGASEDNRLCNYLTQKGLSVNFEIWTDPTVNWCQYDLIILKSPWDYFDRIEEFRNWLDLINKQPVKILNPTPVVRWNLAKSYLLEVEQAGFAIVPTVVIRQQDKFTAAPYFNRWQTDTIIVKPEVSGGAKNTFTISKTETTTFEKQINALLATENYLVQPFMPEIQTAGEWSLIFFNSQFSHAVRKVPQSGDFRVQHYFGGAIIPDSPPAAVLAYAEKLLQQFAPGCLYARVDGLESTGGFKLMELELIEPLLYLLDRKQLYDNYYQALIQLAR